MDEHKHKILVALVFTMAMHWVIAQVVALEWIAIRQHWSTMSANCCFPWSDMASRVCNMWRYKRVVEYMKNKLLGNFYEKMF
jgi:hypothetical protein